MRECLYKDIFSMRVQSLQKGPAAFIVAFLAGSLSGSDILLSSTVSMEMNYC